MSVVVAYDIARLFETETAGDAPSSGIELGIRDGLRCLAPSDGASTRARSGSTRTIGVGSVAVFQPNASALSRR